MTAEATRLTLRLEASEPIQGYIDTEDEAEGREFVGWLGLAAALGEALRQAQAMAQGEADRG